MKAGKDGKVEVVSKNQKQTNSSDLMAMEGRGITPHQESNFHENAHQVPKQLSSRN